MLYFKLLFCSLFCINLYAQHLAVVVSKDTDLYTISKKELSKIFLAKTKKLPNGEKAIAVESSNKTYRLKFYKDISNKNEKQLKKYWAKMIFTGRGQPPKKTSSLQELILFLQNNKNAISYLPLKDTNKNLRIIMEIK